MVTFNAFTMDSGAADTVATFDLPRTTQATRSAPSLPQVLTAATLQDDFLHELQREIRRVERSHAALSVVLFRLDASAARQPQQAERLLDVVWTSKRDSDTPGWIGEDTIAVLCPDTDAAGTTAFVRRISRMASTVAHEAVAATYPDSLFESLTRLAQAQADVQDRAAAVPTDLAPGQLLLAGAGHIASRKGYAFKRGLDIVGAGLALVLLAPLMLLVAAAVAVTSPGPVIYRQTRLGRGGVPFTFYKFRSMTTQADDSLHRDFVTRLIRSGDGATDVAPPTDGDRTSGAFKLAADPRITPLGRFMRRTSIDELPQFFNVLKGDMSLVGPRPAIPYEVVSYQPWHMRRMLSLRPGITGLWQVQGRSRVCFNEMVRMDLRYIRDCSLALDLKILLRTILVVLRCEGAG